MTFGLIDGIYHLLDIVRGRWEFPDLREVIIRQRQKYRADVVLIEWANAGIAMCQELRDAGHWYRPIVPQGSKMHRFEGITGRISDGHLLIPKDAHFLAAFRREILDFPAGSNDDQIDAVSQLMIWSRRPQFVDAVLDKAQNGGRATGRLRREPGMPYRWRRQEG